ncbi:MAG: hypothetical protein J6R29_05050 [Clostridia bacterium]|nr:hypothetical protein [Clostridia bacterium]
MLIFLRIVLITYVIAINVYSYMLVLTQKKQMEERLKSSVKDAKLFIAGILGGALGVYIAMFALSYRLQNLLLMVIMPIFIVLNIYLIILAFVNNFGFVVSAFV